MINRHDGSRGRGGVLSLALSCCALALPALAGCGAADDADDVTGGVQGQNTASDALTTVLEAESALVSGPIFSNTFAAQHADQMLLPG